MIIEVNNFEDVQHFQEKFGIPFTCSISHWMIRMLNQYFSEGEEEIELRMSHSILPAAYKINPAMWCDRNAKRVHFPFLQARVWNKSESHFIANRKGKKTIIFLHKARKLLEANKRVTLVTADIPFSYRQQPHTLLSKLRKHGFKNLKQETLLNKTILYYDEYIPRTEI